MCYVLCSWFVEINTWQILKCTYLVLMQCSSKLVEIYSMLCYFGWACISGACQFQLQGLPIFNYQITLFEIQSYLCGACESRLNFTLYLLLCQYIRHHLLFQVWDLFHKKDVVRDLIVQKIKEESLRTYLFTYSSVYDSLSLHTLAEMFSMEKAVAHSIISKMIINEELMVCNMQHFFNRNLFPGRIGKKSILFVGVGLGSQHTGIGHILCMGHTVEYSISCYYLERFLNQAMSTYMKYMLPIGLLAVTF